MTFPVYGRSSSVVEETKVTSKSSSHLRLFHSSCEVAQGKTRVGLILACTTKETPEPVHLVTATGHVGAPPPCLCMVDSPWRVEGGGQWSQPVLAADWSG